jgi:diguanylate cyclase (GGDEF)-like protein
VVFQVLFNIIANLEFSPSQAHRLWNRIWRYKDAMEENLGRKIDFRVALLEYLIDVNHKLRNPKIIEMSLFEKTLNAVIVDELTGLYNRRFFQNQLKYEIARTQRSNMAFSLILFDIDNFKDIVRSLGQEKANGVLRHVARFLVQKTRKTDLIFRYGPDTFMIFLYNIKKNDCLKIAEKIRRLVEKTDVPAGSQSLRLTVSGGIASFPIDAQTAHVLVEKTEKALRLSKHMGKNCLNLFSKHARTAQRIPLKKTVRVERFCEKPARLPVADISLEGVSFVSPDPVQTDTYCLLRLDSDRLLSFLAKIVRVERKKDGYLAGAKFLDMADLKRKALQKYLVLKG